MGVGISDNLDSNGASVIGKKLAIVPETDVAANPGNVGAVRFFSENDDGSMVGTPLLLSPETDYDARLRESVDLLLDTETFNYAAQNTGKHTYTSTTTAMTWNTSGALINSGSDLTAAHGLTFGTYAEFPILGNHSLYCEVEASFSAQPVANVIIDFGMFRRGASTAFAPTDGVFFRLNSTGLFGVINYNGTEAVVSFPTPFAITLNQKYQFIITITERLVQFWINNVLYGSAQTPMGQGQPCMSATLPFSLRYANIGTAGGVIQMALNQYTVTVGGPVYSEPFGSRMNAAFGSYQGLSGGTMGALESGTVTTGTLVFPTAAVPLNASLAANLCNNLGGRSAETFTSALALATDGILQQYQVPAGTVSVPGKRLKISGVKLSAWIQTVMVGGTAIINEFKLGFGNTATSLQTAEAATTKKPRFVSLPELTQMVALTQAVSTQVAQPGGMVCNFVNPIYVNPGEFMELIITHQGATIPTAGVICYDIQYDFSWE